MPKTAADCLALVQRYEREGELFRAYDLARQGLKKFPTDLALKHRAVLCLASTGATRQSAELFDRLGLERAEKVSLATQLGLNIATLRPRLMKDTALATIGRDRKDALAATEAIPGLPWAKEAANRVLSVWVKRRCRCWRGTRPRDAATWDVQPAQPFRATKTLLRDCERTRSEADPWRWRALTCCAEPEEETHDKENRLPRAVRYTSATAARCQTRTSPPNGRIGSSASDPPLSRAHHCGSGVPGRSVEQEPIIKKAIADARHGRGRVWLRLVAAGADILFARRYRPRRRLHVSCLSTLGVRRNIVRPRVPGGSSVSPCLRAAKRTARCGLLPRTST